VLYAAGQVGISNASVVAGPPLLMWINAGTLVLVLGGRWFI
jgi:hypothetical protein